MKREQTATAKVMPAARRRETIEAEPLPRNIAELVRHAFESRRRTAPLAFLRE